MSIARLSNPDRSILPPSVAEDIPLRKGGQGAGRNGNWSRPQWATAYDIGYGECQRLRENWDRAAQTGMSFAYFSGC